MVLCHYDSNIILFRSVKNRSDAEGVRVNREFYQCLEDHNFKPRLSIIDDEVPGEVKRFITQAKSSYQLVEPNNHRVNATMRATCTFKNNFVAGLSSINSEFPSCLWEEPLPQAKLTLNLLRLSRTCLKLSAHAHINGAHNYNVTPLSPPGIQAMLCEDPTHRATNSVHGINAFYLGPALEH